MKVAYFAGSLIKNIDGVARVLYQISDFNKKAGIESLFISPDTDAQLNNAFLQLRGMAVPGYPEYKLSMSTTNYVQKALEARQFTPDLIHVHSPCTTGLAGVKLAQKLHLPCVATYHTHFVSYLSYHKGLFLEKWLTDYMRYFYRQCQVVLVPSFTVKEELVKMGIEHTRVLPHGVDFEQFNPHFYSSALRSSANGKKILLYVGRLVWEKNLRVFIEAMNSLAQRRDDFVVWMAGTGNAEKEVKSRLPNAQFLGFCDGDQLSQLYATADALVFPSATETFGNVTLEAMASRTCCLVANAGGSKDLIESEVSGLVFEPDNVEELLAKTARLLDQEELRKRFAEKGYERAGKYAWSTILSNQYAMYQELISEESEKVAAKR